MSDFLRRFAQAFATLDKHNLHLLDSLYSKDIAFTDPLHDVHGLTALHQYFAQLYGNVSQLRFDFHGFDKVYRHRDYFDAGAMLYEHLPVVGRVVSWLKRRIG